MGAGALGGGGRIFLVYFHNKGREAWGGGGGVKEIIFLVYFHNKGRGGWVGRGGGGAIFLVYFQGRGTVKENRSDLSDRVVTVRVQSARMCGTVSTTCTTRR